VTEFETSKAQLNDSMLDSPDQGFEGIGQDRDREAAFGPVLEQLEEQGAIVFQDVPGRGFDLDHVAIHPTGIYVFDTSTWSTPGRDHAVVNFDGSSIRLNGDECTDKPIIKARAASAWLQGMLQSATGRRVMVRPTLVFPGRFVESAQALDAELWVLSPGAVAKAVANASPVLSRQDVMLAAYHLSRYIEACEAT
jgi:hypothetical protein